MPDVPNAKTKEGAKPSAKSPAGQRVGPYVLVEKLASGGMAEIFLARHDRAASGFTKELVLKLLAGRFADDEIVRGMFLEEARLGAKLHHQGIVDVYDAGEDAGTFYIAMEYIRGKTLTDVMLRAIELSRPLPIPLAVLITAQVAEGLAYLQQGIDLEGRPLEIIHRDISPMNLVVGVSGQTKIIDFGIAKRGRAKEEAGVRPGKLSYMSPEQVRGQPLDGRSDIFSLGTILYEITVGKRLWRGPQEEVMRRIVDESPPPPTYLVRGYPPALELIVQRALEKRPEARYATAESLCDDLEAFLEDAEGSERLGTRQLARYLHELFAPGAQVSEKGVRRAQAFLDDEGALGDEDIDFDRPAVVGAGAAFARALRASDARPGNPASTDADVSRGAVAPSAVSLGADTPGVEVEPLPLPPVEARETLRDVSPGASLGPKAPAALKWTLIVLLLVICGMTGLIWSLVKS